jgi:hypothetical protein
MKPSTVLLWAVASAAAQGVFAQNGAGSGPPQQSKPTLAPPIVVPLIQKPLMLPIRLAAMPVGSMEIAIRRERELA